MREDLSIFIIYRPSKPRPRFSGRSSRSSRLALSQPLRHGHSALRQLVCIRLTVFLISLSTFVENFVFLGSSLLESSGETGVIGLPVSFCRQSEPRLLIAWAPRPRSPLSILTSGSQITVAGSSSMTPHRIKPEYMRRIPRAYSHTALQPRMGRHIQQDFTVTRYHPDYNVPNKQPRQLDGCPMGARAGEAILTQPIPPARQNREPGTTEKPKKSCTTSIRQYLLLQY